MDMSTTDRKQVSEALTAFVDVWSASDTAHDVGGALQCSEADALADLMRAVGHSEAAEHWVNAHRAHDEPGDEHYITAPDDLIRALENIEAQWESVTFEHGDPDAFGAGHLVLDRGDEERLAITELTDRPDDDPQREITGWTYQAEVRHDGSWQACGGGECDRAHMARLVAYARAWASCGNGTLAQIPA